MTTTLGLLALARLGSLAKGWRLSIAERFDRGFGDDEAVKCALAANLAYYHDDPGTLWWILFAAAQGGFLGSGGCYIRGGSQRLSHALATAVKSAGGAIDCEFPGFAAKAVASVFSTASTMRTCLNAPEGALYGFAPLPPSGPIWREKSQP